MFCSHSAQRPGRAFVISCRINVYFSFEREATYRMRSRGKKDGEQCSADLPEGRKGQPAILTHEDCRFRAAN
jgi:hypothetical protein